MQSSFNYSSEGDSKEVDSSLFNSNKPEHDNNNEFSILIDLQNQTHQLKRLVDCAKSAQKNFDKKTEAALI